MIESELITLWQSSPQHERIKFEKSRLMLDVQSNLDGFDKAVNQRDFLEIGAAIFVVIPIFAYQAYHQPSTLAKFGAVYIVVYCLYVVYRLLETKKGKPSEHSSYLEYLRQSKVYLMRQKNLLDSALYWYILPGLAGFAIMLMGMLDLYNKPWGEIIRTKKVWIGILACAAVIVFLPALNKWSVKKELVPRIKKVDELLQLLDEDD